MTLLLLFDLKIFAVGVVLVREDRSINLMLPFFLVKIVFT